MNSPIFKKLLIGMVKYKFTRRYISNIVHKRYRIKISTSAKIEPSTNIPNGTTLCDNSALLSNASIGHDTTLEAGASIDHSCPPYSVISGNPGQVSSFNLPHNEPKAPKQLLASYTLDTLIKYFKFSSILDIGSGQGLHANIMLNNNKITTCIDIGNSVFFRQNKNKSVETIIGDYNNYQFKNKFDCIWASHVLEHQVDTHSFLKKTYKDLNIDGILAVTVPPLKHEIVGGHVSIYNMGLLLYRLILAGFDCSQAHCIRYGYNISIIVKKKPAKLPHLDYDSGDIDKLSHYFPFKACENFHGNIHKINWPWDSPETPNTNDGKQ